MKRKTPPREDVILLKDLTPHKEVKGGSGKRVFGEFPEKKQRAAQPARGKAGRRRTTKA